MEEKTEGRLMLSHSTTQLTERAWKLEQRQLGLGVGETNLATILEEPWRTKRIFDRKNNQLHKR